MSTIIKNYRNSFVDVQNQELRILMDPWINTANEGSWAGCNGLKYYIEPTNDSPRKHDEFLENENVIICGDSILFLLGSEVVWTTDTMGSRIEFINPNAKNKCGCGETFSPMN